MRSRILFFLVVMLLVGASSAYAKSVEEKFLDSVRSTLAKEMNILISEEQVVFFSSREETRAFFVDVKETANLEILYGSTMFTRAKDNRIFVNGWDAIWEWIRQDPKRSCYTVLMASIMAHEAKHTEGERSELIAHRFELETLDYLTKSFSKKKMFDKDDEVFLAESRQNLVTKIENLASQEAMAIAK